MIHISKYDAHPDLRLYSEPVLIDFYFLALKMDFETEENFGKTEYDDGRNSFAYFDKPKTLTGWNVKRPWKGFHILIHKSLFKDYAKNYNFSGYDRHEALFLNQEEETLLADIFNKAYAEYLKPNFSEDILLSYSNLILSYIHSFYKRQFDTRQKIYNQIVSDFNSYLDQYFDEKNESYQLPTVTFFADKANLSSNYFGDVIKHFTGRPPVEHIHDHIIRLAKIKLSEPNANISQIGYSLGFEYPSYFTHFFKKKTGFTPSKFRNK
ncbi:helix-turn-helix domain-containing protein [Limibacter armeniacum]|uniref:helix-turn-helix domain-containing protein n=1 Tax=Limibacter armeniacum TaxID=466084 RepID=UPI002FE58842